MDSIIAEDVRSALALQIDKLSAPQNFDPTPFDIYVASSGLQKAIRRGELSIALRCAARLLRDDKSRLWRRLVNIAFEDVGAANPSVVAQVVSAAGNQAWRKLQGGDEKVVAYLIRCLCESVKDRTADDLIVLCERDTELRTQRQDWPHHSNAELSAIISSDSWLPAQALATWCLVGTHRLASRHISYRFGDPSVLWSSLRTSGISDAVIEISRLGLMRGGAVLAPFYPLVVRSLEDASLEVLTSMFPPSDCVGDMPSYVFDRYTRAGKIALTRFNERSWLWRSFLEGAVPRHMWLQVTGDCLFRIEGASLNKRTSCPLIEVIRDCSNVLIPGLRRDTAREAMALMSALFPTFELIRLEAINEHHPNL